MSHVVTRKPQVWLLDAPRLADTASGKIETGYVEPADSQLPSVTTSAAAQIQYASPSVNVNTFNQRVHERRRFAIVTV
jgi:hypothetical protein